MARRQRAEDAKATGTPQGVGGGAIVHCLVPFELAAKLHDRLARHFGEDPSVEVMVEQRCRERRGGCERRKRVGRPPDGVERRTVRSPTGRRVAERRARVEPLQPGAAPALPRGAQRYAERLLFLRRLEPSPTEREDAEAARLVIGFQSGDGDAFTELYMRYFARVYAYLRVAFKDAHEAEDAAQQVFMQVFENLDRYERRAQPFRAWLFTLTRHYAVRQVPKLGRVEPTELEQLDAGREHEHEPLQEPPPSALAWVSDPDLMVFFERLPLPQRQVLTLGFMVGLSDAEIAAVLERSQVDVRTLRHRALRFLEARLRAVGRSPRQGRRVPWRGRVRKAPVLRMRRHALSP